MVCAAFSTVAILLSVAMVPAMLALTPSRPSSDEVAAAIEALIRDRKPSFLVQTSREHAELTRLHSARRFSPLWLDATGKPGLDARAAAAVLGGAADDGLDPDAYSQPERPGWTERLEEQSTGQAEGQARLDVDLSATMMRYLRHLHVGRVDPRTIGFRLQGRGTGADATPVEPLARPARVPAKARRDIVCTVSAIIASVE
jgi:murein L,D-transpeptidase YcbB/YkuD